MKRFLSAALLSVATLPAVAGDVAVSISLGEPGFYGQIDIGDYPPPRQYDQVITQAHLDSHR